MHNQITENIACNSEYYNKILDDNIRNHRFQKILKNIETALNHSISPDKFRKPPVGGTTPVPKLDIEKILNYFHINFFNEPFSVSVTNKKRACNTFVLVAKMDATHDVIISSKDYIKNGKNLDAITYKGWPVKIQNRIANSPTRGKDTITIVYTQDIFHFSFHSTTSKSLHGNCVAEDWDYKAKGAFHLKLDCMQRATSNVPLVESKQGEQYYFPFVYDISANNFMTMGTIIGKPANDLYTSTKTNTMFRDDAVDKNMCHNADTADLWYNYSNGRKFFLRDSSGAVITDTIDVPIKDASGVPITDDNGVPITKTRRVPQTYIHKVISPLYNYIVLQLNESMTLPSDQEWHLSRPDTFGRDPAPTPVACSKIPTQMDMILCAANPSYNDQVNEFHLTNLNRREEHKDKTPQQQQIKPPLKTSGGKHRKTRRPRQPNL
jgi:hypothetical protein